MGDKLFFLSLFVTKPHDFLPFGRHDGRYAEVYGNCWEGVSQLPLRETGDKWISGAQDAVRKWLAKGSGKVAVVFLGVGVTAKNGSAPEQILHDIGAENISDIVHVNP